MSATPNPHRRLGFSLAPTPSPFLTPRPERRTLDLRWADGSSASGRQDRDREVNIQVIVRCRPLNEEEQKLNIQNVISCNEQRKEVTVLQGLVNKQADKTFTFDKVFGPKSQQRSIYGHAISPIVYDVLEGYNCTVFAFGQTGTGKTYTMEGEMRFKGGDLLAEAGVIPRAVCHIFDTLEARKTDYSMKISFFELYNEEITDLLAPEDQTRFPEDRQRRPISLMEDGKGGAVIRGLEEVVVYSPSEIYSLLERGSAKRRTADTLLNKQSSRSHSVFSITIHRKESTVGNEEVVKCGRLNLVDLAGSENISRSGAREWRVREAGEINKSLLTLGRVITALVEHSVHIPYRDSKLTRLLRESLGGKAKTCIIATVSPSSLSLEETLSTLDYAYRAKSIKNKPEINQKLSKSVLLKDLNLEIEKLKQDVRAAREKNGVYIPQERFVQDEAEKKAMREKIEQLELLLDQKSKQADRFKELYHSEQERNLDLESQNREFKINFESSKKAFQDLQEVHKRTNLTLKEKDFVISNLLISETAILERAKDLRGVLESASEDITVLFAKMERQSNKEAGNKELILKFGSQLDYSLKSLQNTVVGSVCDQHQLLKSMEEQLSSFLAKKCEATKCFELKIQETKEIYTSGVQRMNEFANSLQRKSFSDLEEMKLMFSSHALALGNFLVTAVSEAEQVLNDLQRSLSEQKELLAFSAQQQEMVLQRSLLSTQAISKTTVDFFNDLKAHACKLMKETEENHMERTHQLADFEETFKELSAKEEKAAIEKIAGILASLTAMRTKMVSSAVHRLSERCSQEANKLQLHMSSMQQASDSAKKEWISFVEKGESRYQEDISSSARLRNNMENVLHQCSEKVGQSMCHWAHTQLSINQLNKDYGAEIEYSIDRTNQDNGNVFGELVSESSNTDVEFDKAIGDLLASSKSSLLLDHQTTEGIEPLSSFCLDHLKSLQDNHSGSIESIRILAEKCFLEDYLVDSPIRRPLREQEITVPSLKSIEELRKSLTDVVREFRSENGLKGEVGGKQQMDDQLTQTPRIPFMPIN
ncbi:kinesin-like protein KIN-5B [Ananas comosus]|uniref:Kinesin-like protein KIN-5B n=1 Tax=Ananas comosus TaxID=4615 RepID=A0A6P5F2D5_ANACO|nr:kinesin-like protein KIN-5B [Ananas comosus]